ncbi:uncharacterized protein LOC111000964 [Pieris rapae]|uniref:uncharacterized protein LOC111000964 n=1 Tax=Pieris rapae TaxID=64459 RepID=UPI000B92D4F1|nr:uncharacterized protein LOC111000964 [Pieris rapae]
MSFEKMEVVNPAEKEASEVLHSLLSVERRSVDSKEAIIVSIPSDQNGGGEYGESAQWHTPVMGQHSVFELGGSQNMQQHNYNGHQEQVLWQSHTIQVENGDGNLQGMQTQYSIEFEANVENQEMDVETKPKMEKKAGIKRKKKVAESDSDDEVLGNSLEDNPEQVKERLRRGCDCKDNCYRGLNPEAVYRHRLNIAELTKSEHDMYLMGITMASLANPAETSRHKVRRRLRACYVYQGRKVCLEAFLYLENVTHYQLKRIRQHVMTHGVAPRIHGNVGKKPYNTFTLDIYKHATNFLKEYLKQHASSPKDVQPSAESGKKGSKTVIIQGDSRKHLFEAYKEYGEILEPGVKLMGYSTFRAFMKDQFPHVKFATKKQELSKDMVPFRSGKCMTYDKNKDPLRIQQEKEKADAKKAAMEAKKKEEHDREHAQQQAQQQQVQQQQQQQQQQVQQVQVQHQQMQGQPHVVIHQQQSQQQQQMQQQMLVPQVSQHQQVLTQQVGGVQQVSQQHCVQPLGVSEDNGQPVEMAQQVHTIPLAVVQQPQQAYAIVTPVSHFQTRVQGTWYRH